MTIKIQEVPTLEWVQPDGVPFSEGHHVRTTETIVTFPMGPRGFNVVRSLHDAMVFWTTQVRAKAIAKLIAQEPSLYARFDLATLETYQDKQRFCSYVTGQSYCEVRGDSQTNTLAAIFGGSQTAPVFENNPTPIPHVEGGFVYWYSVSFMRAGFNTGGYETVCRIVKPENWAGDEVEAQHWVDFVEANLDEVVESLKSEEDPLKQYFDVRRIPDAVNVRSLLGHSPLSYRKSNFFDRL